MTPHYPFIKRNVIEYDAQWRSSPEELYFAIICCAPVTNGLRTLFACPPTPFLDTVAWQRYTDLQLTEYSLLDIT